MQRANGKQRRKRTNKDVPQDAAAPADLSPLDFALGVMRDDEQPMALRASMAKVAIPYQHNRGMADEAPEQADAVPPLSTVEWARRAGFYLNVFYNAARELDLCARGVDVAKTGLPEDRIDWAAVQRYLMRLRGEGLPQTTYFKETGLL